MAGLVIQDKMGLAAHLNEATGRLFDGDAAVLPIPEDASPEIPRIILRSKSGTTLLQLSQKRLDILFVLPNDAAEPIPFPSSDLPRLLLALRDAIADAADRSFERAALISNWVAKSDKPGRDFLRERFFRRDSPAAQAIELEIHALERADLAGCDTNSWTRIKTARKADALEDDRYLTVLVDINSNAEKTYDFSGDLLERFMDQGQALLQTILTNHLGECR